MDVSSGDYYRRLQLSPTASRHEIKSAFRRLARQYHPDLHPNEPEAAAKFQALREAYNVLIDRVQRQHYDQQQPATPKPPQTPSDFYLRGIHHALAHRYGAALKAYGEAIARDTHFSEAYLRRAEVHYVLENDPAVLADCQAAIALNATDAKTHYYQGLARYRLGYVQSAIAAFCNAITCDPEDARYYHWRGLAHQDLNEKDQAAKDFRQAAQLYRSQGDMSGYKAMRCSLKSLGNAGRAWPRRVFVRIIQQSFRYTLWPLLQSVRRCFNRTVQGQAARAAASQAADRSLRSPFKSPFNHSHEPSCDSTPDSTPGAPHSGANDDPLSQQRSPQWHYPKQRPVSTNQDQPGAFQAQQHWAPGVSSRPDPSLPWPRRLTFGAKTLLKLLSNPAGEMAPVYHRLPAGKHALIGYSLAVFANLCFMAGVAQFFAEVSWLLIACLWASGAFTFVAMVLAVSLVRLRLRNRGRWAADIFILGTTLLPLGSLALLSALLPVLGGRLNDAWGVPLTLLSLGAGALWAFSHAFLTLHSGLSQIQRFPAAMSAWLTPTILTLGLGAGVCSWMVFCR